MTGSLIYHLLSDLSASLEADGYDIGTGKYLQVQELLRRLPEDTPPERLASLLCPLFARNRQEQQWFYAMFDQSLSRAKALTGNAESPLAVQTHIREARVWRNALLAMTAIFSFLGGYILEVEVFQPWRNPTIAIVLGTILAAGYFIRRTVDSKRKRRVWLLVQIFAIVLGAGAKQAAGPRPPAPSPPEYREFALRPGDTLVQYVRTYKEDSLLFAQLSSGATLGTDSVFGVYSVNERGRFTYIVQDTFDFFRDTISVESFFASARHDTTYFVVVLQPNLEDLDLVRDTIAVALLEKTTPFPRDISLLLPDAGRAYIIKLYSKYAWMVKLFMITLFALGLWALLQWRERRRRYLSAAVQERSAPPYTWNLRIEHPGEIIPGESAPLLLNLLRRRTRGDTTTLDISASIRATIRRLGMADFRYRRLTAPPDYLLLIDRQSPNDHRAMLFDWLFRRFHAQEAPLMRYFFEGDLRLCFDEKHPGGISLPELQHRYGNARLLVLSHGHQLLSPLSGRIERWVALLTDWRRRALLSPVPLRAWGRREEQLRDVFTVVPATMQGWGAAIEQLDALEPQNIDEQIQRLDDISLHPIRLDGDLIPSLQTYFEEPVLDWIAACAVYPLLQWELTLFLGKELSTPNNSLLHFDNLLNISRLPWFVSGRIPEAARMELLDYLAQRGLEERIRGALHRLLTDTSKPDPASVAFEEYRVNAALNELAITQNLRQKQNLRSELEGFQSAGYAMDAVAFRYIKKPASRADFAVPQFLKRLAAPANRLSPAWKDWIWALPLWALFTAFVLSYNVEFDLCGKGRPVSYEGLDLCIANPGDELFFNELLISDFVKKGNRTAADSILIYSRSLFPACISHDTISFLKNTAVYFYNKGVSESVRLQIDSSFQLDATSQWPEAMCYWFAQAYGLDASAGGIADIDVLSAASRCRYVEPATDSSMVFPLPGDEAKPVVVRGRVVEAGRKNGLSGVAAIAGEFKALSDKNGYYAIEFPPTAEGKTLVIRFEKNGYQPGLLTLRIEPGRTPPVVELSQLDQSPERPRTFSKAGLMGLQDSKGKVLLPPEYSFIEYDSGGGWFRVGRRLKADASFGYVDTKGQTVIPVIYRNIGPLRDGLVRTENETGWGYLDRQGRVIIPFQYQDAGDFSGGTAEVSLTLNQQRVRYSIDKSGRCIANCPTQQEQAPATRPPTKLSFSGDVVLYFDVNVPSTTPGSYEDLYGIYYKRKSLLEKEAPSVQQNNIGGADGGISRFFEMELRMGKEALESRLGELAGILQAGLAPGETIVMSISGFSSSNESDPLRLAKRRAESIEEWALRFNKRILLPFRDSGKLLITTDGKGDQGIRGKEAYDWLRDARQRRASVSISVQIARN